MPVYSLNGTPSNIAYSRAGTLLSQAYNIQGNPLLSQGTGSPLKVMTYNVGQWYIGTGSQMPAEAVPTYPNLQHQIMDDNRPDVLAVQEYRSPMYTGITVDSVIGEFFTDTQNTLNTGYKAKALYTNGYPISDYEAIDFPNDSSWNYLKAKITVDGKDVWLINTHLITSYSMADADRERKKVEQAGYIFNAVKNLDRFIIMGDFNVICKNTNHVEYITMMKQFVGAGYNMTNCSPQSGFIRTCSETTDMFNDGEPCDIIITSPNIVIDNAYLDDNKFAVVAETGNRFDHLPVIAELTIY